MKKKDEHDRDESPYCIVCDRRVKRFSDSKYERRYSETGLCESCQKAIQNAMVKEKY
jgi:hypothetical protein